MAEIKMVVTDLDGTLLRDDKSISAYTEKIIENVRPDTWASLIMCSTFPETSRPK